MLFRRERQLTVHSARKIGLYFLLVLAGIGLFVRLLADMPQTEPDPNVKVIVFEPTGTAGPTSNITLKFSRDMVPDDSLDKPILDPPLKIEPLIPGIARWIEKNIIRFYPDDVLPPATEFVCQVKSDKTFLYGNRINDDRKFEFRTPDLAVFWVNDRLMPSDRSVDHRKFVIEITFNYPVAADELSQQLSIESVEDAEKSSLSFEVSEPRGRPISPRDRTRAELATGRGNKTLVVITEEFPLSAKRQTYQLMIRSGLKCVGCAVPMPNPFFQTLTVEPLRRFVVERAGARGRGRQFNIQINFSEPVDIDEARDYIRVDPEIALEIEQSRSTLLLLGDFKPGKSYEVSIDKGLPSIRGQRPENEFSTIITVPDLPPSIRFTSRGVFLPDRGTGLIEFESVNIGEISVEVEEIFANNIVYFLGEGYGRYYAYSRDISALGRSFFIRDFELNGVKNEPLSTTVDLAGIVGERSKGIFKISVRNKKERWTGDSRNVLLTDIGISARMADTYLMVWVNSLKDTRALYGAEIKLISRNNQVLAEGKTDSRGIAIIDDISQMIEGFDPFLLVVTYEDDLAYLQFDQCRLPISDFDVGGRPYLAQGYEAFVYTERGIYRPGDTAHIVTIVRGKGCTVPEEFPFLVTVYDPQGRKFKEIRQHTTGSSFSDIDLEIPAFARTGKYSATVHIGETYVIGRTEFQVEEFMPDRIKVSVNTSEDGYSVGETVDINVTGKFLFGPPAAGHNVSGHVTIEDEVFTAQGWSGYSFRDDSKKFAKQEVDLPEQTLDEEGRHTYQYEIPDEVRPPSMLKALISATVSEQGGRAVNGYREIRIFPYESFVGVKLNLEGYARIDEPVEINLAAVDGTGAAAVLDSIQVKMYRLVYQTVLKKDAAGYLRYVSEESARPRDSVILPVSADGALVSFTPADYGRYRIIATDLTGGHSASATFYASGWGYAPWAMTNPDRIELGFDKSSYSPGEKALVQVRAPFGGKLLMTIEKEKILDFITVDMEENTAEIELPVKSDYFPNVYVTATLIKPADKIEKSLPARAFGMAPLMLSNKPKKLAVEISMPEVMKPDSRLTVDVSLTLPEVVEVALALVDVGVLQLTDYKTPDPLDFFHGKKRPYLAPYDIYDFVFPETEMQASNLSPGGGRMFAEARKRHLNPIKAQRVKPVALWSGIVETDRTGKAVITFDVPQFNGALKAMAVAVRGDLFGSAEKTVIVRDKIVLQESFPRFLTPNDEIEGLVTLFNNTGADADIEVELKLDGPVQMISSSRQTVHIRSNAEGGATFKFKAGLVPGTVKCTIIARSGSEKTEVSFELANRPAQPLYTEHGSGVVTETAPAEFVLPGDWVEDTDKYRIKTSSLAAVGFLRDFEFLLRYPYGCVEQTTSKLFPLLYYTDLARFLKPELVGSRGAEYFIQEGIIRLTGFMNDKGAFSFWPGGTTFNNWASVYASHFLVEAENAGYYVDKNISRRISDNLSDIARGRTYKDVDDALRIYAAYVLGRAGKTEKRVVSYLKKVNPDAITPYSKYQLAGALALAGEIDLARELVPLDIHPEIFEPETGRHFSSGVRTNAILLDVLLDIDPENSSIPVLAQSLIDNSRVGRWYTTQASAFALMALGRYFKEAEIPDFTGEIRIDGDITQPIDTGETEIVREDLGGKEVSISITGKGNCYYYWQASGVSTSHAPEEFARGIEIYRDYRDQDGKPIALDSINLGDQIVCIITAVATDRSLSYVIINDLIPSGFEIENPRIKTTPRLSWIPSHGREIEHMDIRDDRLLLFVNLHVKQTTRFYYSLRAVCAGDFTLPPISAECMYNPLIAGSGSSGRIRILGEK